MKEKREWEKRERERVSEVTCTYGEKTDVLYEGERGENRNGLFGLQHYFPSLFLLCVCSHKPTTTGNEKKGRGHNRFLWLMKTFFSADEWNGADTNKAPFGCKASPFFDRSREIAQSTGRKKYRNLERNVVSWSMLYCLKDVPWNGKYKMRVQFLMCIPISLRNYWETHNFNLIPKNDIEWTVLAMPNR